MVRSVVIALSVLTLTLGSSLALAKPPEETLVALPPVGEESEVDIGTTMVSAIMMRQIPIITTTQSYTAKGTTVPPGELRYDGSDLRGKYFLFTGEVTFKFLGMTVPAPGGLYIYDDGSGGDVYFSDPSGFRTRAHFPGAVQFTTRFETGTEKPSFKQELIYSGVSKGVVSLSYREFSDDMARPAFTQQLTYDLADGDEIGFRGARFRVIKATNTSIRYVVLKPLSGG